MELSSETYSLSLWIFIKGLAGVYLIAFLSLLPQLLGLFGQNGILSIDNFLGVLEKQPGWQKFWQVPSLFWFNSSDRSLLVAVFLGLTSSSLALMGWAPAWMLLVSWLLYLSFVSTGQDFMGYQWDSLLLEIGFLALFLQPFEWTFQAWQIYEYHPLVKYIFWVLLFKLMLGSGLAKLLSRDLSWRNLEALQFHFWTQPLPNTISFFVAKLPKPLLKLSTLAVLTVELIVPFFIFMPLPWQLFALSQFLILQFLIFITGNYTFFNILSALLALTLVPDSLWQTLPALEALLPGAKPLLSDAWIFTHGLVAFVTIPLSLFWLSFSISEKWGWNRLFVPVARSLYYLRINNHYGLFAVMTRTRPELILEGSMDGETWKAYEFHYKASVPNRRPRHAAPHQPRLDWQMWFAALGHFYQNLWLQNMMVRIFWQSPEVLSLFKTNPFPEQAPEFLRLNKYHYRFSSWQEWRTSGQWWQREYIGPYSPVLSREEFG